MTFRPLACGLALVLAAGATQALADCRPDPLAGRLLYLRGSFNNWSAEDDAALRYVCDHWEIVARLSGTQTFKVADEDWSPDADFGAAGNGTLQAGATLPLARKGAALKAEFKGMARITVTPAATADGTLTLRIADLPADTPLPGPDRKSVV